MNNIGLFIGTKRGYNVLKQLFNNNYKISGVLVLIQNSNENNIYDKKIISFCEKNNIIFSTSGKIKSPGYKKFIIELKIDVLFCVSWRFLIKEECFSIPKKGIFVLHDSLLPKYRGFAPTNWVLINGEKHTGLTLQEISKYCDAGNIVDQIKFKINDLDDANIINNKLIELYPKIILDNIEKIFKGNYKIIKQNEKNATFTCKRVFEDGKINFNDNIDNIFNLIRGSTWPYYGAYCYLNDELVYIWEVEKIYKNYVGIIPGRVVEFFEDGVGILCGDGNILKVKKISKKNNKSFFEKPNKLLYSIKFTLK